MALASIYWLSKLSPFAEIKSFDALYSTQCPFASTTCYRHKGRRNLTGKRRTKEGEKKEKRGGKERKEKSNKRDRRGIREWEMRDGDEKKEGKMDGEGGTGESDDRARKEYKGNEGNRKV